MNMEEYYRALETYVASRKLDLRDEKSELLPHRERVRIPSLYQRHYILNPCPRFCLPQNRGLRIFEETILFGRSYFSSACLTTSGSAGSGLSFWS